MHRLVISSSEESVIVAAGWWRTDSSRNAGRLTFAAEDSLYMGISGFGDYTLGAELAWCAIGLPALLLAYLGVLTFGLPAGGRALSAAFLRAIPLSIVAWLVTVLAVGIETEHIGAPSEGTCQLAANYSLMMVDSEGSGWVYNRKNENGRGVNWQTDGIDGVEIVQTSGRFILGGRDSHGFRPSHSHAVINEYFLIDTERETVTRFSTLPQLQAAASQLGIPVELKPVYEVYSSCGEFQSRTENRPQRAVVGTIYFFCIGFVGLLVWWGITLWRLRAALRPA